MNFALAKEKQKKGSGNRGKDLQDNRRSHPPDTEEGCWIALTNPTATEIFEFSEKFDIEVDDLRSPLDEEERSRIEVEDNYTLILVDVPMIEERNDKDWYGTIPLGIIVTGSIYYLSGGHTGSDQIYGRKSPELFYLYEDPFYFPDPLQKCKYVPALSAYHRQEK